MTIIDELLILLDNFSEIGSEEIAPYLKPYNLQIIFSSLGRLVNRGWAKKQTRRNGVYYSITARGVDRLNQTLDSIKDIKSAVWDGNWYLVIFDIPENKRKQRDNLRQLLKNLQYGMLTAGVWVSPRDYSQEVRRFIKRYNLMDNILLLTANTKGEHYRSAELARKGWDWARITDHYKQFIKKCESELTELQKETNIEHKRFRAKKLVFQYADVVSNNPQLAEPITPNLTVFRRAHDLYMKVRPYCLG